MESNRCVESCTKVRTMWHEVKISQDKSSKLKIKIQFLKLQIFGQTYTSNHKRDAQCEFHHYWMMVRCSKLGERYRALWRLNRKWGMTTILEQKCTSENCERNTQRKYTHYWTMVKCSKLGEKYKAFRSLSN